MDEVKDHAVMRNIIEANQYHLDDRFGELAVGQIPLLRSIAYSSVHDQNAAEDIALEAVAKVCRVLKRQSIAMARAYLNTAVKSVAADYIERSIRNNETSVDALLEKEQVTARLTEFSEPLDMVIHNEEVEEVLSALTSLPPRMAAAIRLRYLEDLDYDSIAQRLGYSVNTIKSDVRRGIKRLRRNILKARGATAYSKVA